MLCLQDALRRHKSYNMGFYKAFMLMIQTMYIVGILAQRLPIGDINQIVLLLLIKLSAINLKAPLLQQILALTIYLSPDCALDYHIHFCNAKAVLW